MSDSHGEFGQLPAFDGNSDRLNVVLEVSKGSRIKLKYERGLFRSEKVLPLGLVFPFDFGFIPSTLAEDGDPLDAIVLSEDGLPARTVVYAKAVKIIKCKQTEKGRTRRNDRIVVLPLDAKSREPMQPTVKFDSVLEEAISRFFVEYNKLQGKTFRVIGIESSRSALAAIRKGAKRAGAEKK